MSKTEREITIQPFTHRYLQVKVEGDSIGLMSVSPKGYKPMSGQKVFATAEEAAREMVNRRALHLTRQAAYFEVAHREFPIRTIKAGAA